MNKKTFLSMLFAGTASVACTHATSTVCAIEPGNVVCGQGSVTDLSGNGMVTTNGTTVLEGTTVNGLLKATRSTFGSLQVHGTATLSDCIINHAADFKGTVSATSSQFKQSLDIYSGLSRFTNSTIEDSIRVHHTDNPKQVVHLEKNTRVNGDIVFDDGHGEVIVRGKSNISGQVIGGEIIYK